MREAGHTARWVGFGLAALMTVSAGTESVRADLTIIATVETVMQDVREEVRSTMYLKGPWLRREWAGEGSLARYFDAVVEIRNRHTGSAVKLYPDDKTYDVTLPAPPSCGTDALVETGFLGRVRGDAEVSVSFPDTAIEVLDCDTWPVQIQITPRRTGHGAGTTIRFWVCADYARVFGPEYQTDLFCGRAPDKGVQALKLGSRLQSQFGLTDADALLLAGGLDGYPLLIESLSGTAGAGFTATRVTLEAVNRDTLPDSLFRPPASYRDLSEAPEEQKTPALKKRPAKGADH